MTDLEKFIDLYKSLGIEITVYPGDEGEVYFELFAGAFRGDPRLTGYGGFHTRVTFSADGKFMEQGFWE
jgi:hypothetical protein